MTVKRTSLLVLLLACLLMGLLVGCGSWGDSLTSLFDGNPWADVQQRELVWSDTSRIEQELGIDLVELPHGEPVGAWPRVVVYADRIEFDNRAWFLSLTDEQRATAGTEVEKQRTLLREAIPVAQLEDGLWRGGESQRWQAERLLVDLLLKQRERKDLALAQAPLVKEGAGGDDVIVVVERGVPFEIVWVVARALVQSSRTFWVAGQLDGRLVAIHLPLGGFGEVPGYWCATQVNLELREGGSWLVGTSSPPLTGPGGCRNTDWKRTISALARLTKRCTPRWEAWAAEVYGRHDKPVPTQHEWACSTVQITVPPDLGFEPVAQALASLHSYGPELIVGRPKSHHPGSRERCRFAIQPSELSEAQLDHICASDFPSELLESLLDGERTSLFNPSRVAPFALEHHIEVFHYGGVEPFSFFSRETIPLLVGSGLREVFPEYAQWRQHFLNQEFEKSALAGNVIELQGVTRSPTSAD